MKFFDPEGMDVIYANDKDREFFQASARKSDRVRRVLEAFKPGSGRDLQINRGDPGSHPVSKAPFAALTEVTLGRLPADGAMLDAYNKAGQGEAGDKAALAVEEAAKSEARKATITIGPEASSKHMLHELGHVEQALHHPADYEAQASAARQATTKRGNDQSDSEKYADSLATSAEEAVPEPPKE